METAFLRAVAAAKGGNAAPWVALIAKEPKTGIMSNGVDVTEFSSAADLTAEVRETEGLSPAVRATLYAAIKKYHG